MKLANVLASAYLPDTSMRIRGLFARPGIVCLTAVLLALWLFPASAQKAGGLGADRVSDAAGFAQRLALSGHRPAWAVAAADRGALPDAQNVQLIFALTRAPEVQAAFEQLLADQQNPSSPRFHQWLTPQQVGAQFGPTEHDLDALTNWLAGQGFKVDAVTPSRVFVQASAPAAVVSAALGTDLHSYEVSYGSSVERMQAPTAEPSLPASLAPLVAYVGGLTVVPVHTFSHMEVRTSAASAAAAGSAAAGTANVHPDLTANSTTHFVTPLDFNKIYDVPTIAGAGQKVMIIGGSRLNAADLSYFESDTALASYSPNTIVDPAYADPGQTSDGNQGEATLDFERVYGTDPAAQVDLVIAANWLNGAVNQNLILYAINTVNDPVMSLSFGACENLQPSGYVKQEDAMYSQAASQGITTLVSAGDAGVTGCAVHGVAATSAYAYPNINDICASSYVTCVGGTQFNDLANPAAYWSSTNATGFFSALSYIPEGAWNEPLNTGSNAATVPYVVAATGGGPSTIIAKPTWQTGTGVPADGVRDTPDMSFTAAGHDGYFSCLASGGGTCIPAANGSIGFVAFSGTSASAPSMAGVAALLNQKLGARQGNINPTLYKLAASTPAAFHDTTFATAGVTSCSTATPSTCNNSTPGPTTLTGGVAGYTLQTGYDLITGLGSLDVNAFLTAAAIPTTLATSNSLSATPATITTAQTVVFTDLVANASTTSTTAIPSGTVTFTLNSTGANLGTITLVNASASTAATSFPAAGTYLINVAYSGDSNFAASTASLSLVVTTSALPATTNTLSGTTGTINAQTGATYTAVVAAVAANTLVPSGSVQFFSTPVTTGIAAKFGAAIPVAAGKATLSPTVLPAGSYSISAVYTGDTNFAGSTSNTLSVTSTAIPTTTVTGGIPATVTSTTVTPITATVTSSTGVGTPTGSIQFTVDTVAYGTAQSVPASGLVSLNLTLATGTHSVCANYSGDTTFAASSAACKTVVSTTTPVTIALAPVTASIYSYQTTPLVATITGISPSAAATSSVTFKDGSTTLVTVTPVYSGSTGTYTYTAGPLSVGIHTLTATFNGDGTYSPATSNASTVTVTLATVVLSPASPSLTATAGTAASDVITLTSTNFSGAENLSCTVAFGGTGSAGSLPVCTLSPASVSFGGSGSVSSTLSITTVKRAALGGANFSRNSSPSAPLRSFGGFALCGLLALCVPRRSRKAMRALSLAVLLGLALAAVSGCGSNNFGSGASAPGTSAGPYTVTITAAGTTNVSGSTTVAISVQ